MGQHSVITQKEKILKFSHEELTPFMFEKLRGKEK